MAGISYVRTIAVRIHDSIATTSKRAVRHALSPAPIRIVTPPDANLLVGLRNVLIAGPPLRLAVLFGSQATGLASARSDVDIGIIPHSPVLPLADELRLAVDLSAAVGAEVDLVRLDRDDPLTGKEVAQRGICLFEATPGLFAAYRARAMSHWIDVEETMAPHRDRFLRRLARSHQR